MSTYHKLFAWYSEKQFNRIKNTLTTAVQYNDNYAGAYKNAYKNAYKESKPYIYYYDMDDNIVQVTQVVSVIDGEEPKCDAEFDDLRFIGQVKKCFKTSKYPMTI